MCARVGFLHLIVERERFRLVSGRDCLESYKFNTRTADHLFCRRCGVKPFYVPRSHPDGYSVNSRCLDPESIASLTVLPFDGINWEENVAILDG